MPSGKSDSPQKPSKKPQRGPRIVRGERRQASAESIYKGAFMRSRLEVSFAQELDRRAIAWDYEPERIGGGRYLVDFHLPDLKCWVEVKGRFEARDQLLLPNVAQHLRAGGERLFLYMRSKAYRVTWKGFEPLTHSAFWDAIQDVPEDGPDDLLYFKRKHDRERDDDQAGG